MFSFSFVVFSVCCCCFLFVRFFVRVTCNNGSGAGAGPGLGQRWIHCCKSLEKKTFFVFLFLFFVFVLCCFLFCCFLLFCTFMLGKTYSLKLSILGLGLAGLVPAIFTGLAWSIWPACKRSPQALALQGRPILKHFWASVAACLPAHHPPAWPPTA